SLLHDVGEQADVARTLDRLRQLTLLLGGHRGDPRWDDLAALRQVTLEQADVLVIDDGCVLRAEGAGLAAAEKGSCHCAVPYSSPSRSRPRPPRRSCLRIITDGPFSSSSTLMVSQRMMSSLIAAWRSISAMASPDTSADSIT